MFNSSDYLLFYGQGPDQFHLDFNKGCCLRNNLYTDKNYYFVTVGPSNGLRIAGNQSLTGTYPTITEFDDFTYYETERYNELHFRQKLVWRTIQQQDILYHSIYCPRHRK